MYMIARFMSFYKPGVTRVLACCYPCLGKLHSLQVAFVASTLWVRCDDFIAKWRCVVVVASSACSIKATSLVLLVPDDANDIG